MKTWDNYMYYIWALFVRAVLLPFVLPVRAWEHFYPAPWTPKKPSLEEMVKEFFEEYLDYHEVNDYNMVIFPIKISSYRVVKSDALSKLLLEMRIEVGLGKPKTTAELRKMYGLND